MKAKNFQLMEKQQCGLWLFSAATLLLLPIQSYATAPVLQGYVMQVQMTPAICAMDRNSAKQRKCLEGYSLTIAGLIPETNASDCTTQSSALLSPLQTKVVVRVMPEDRVRLQLWRNIGGCVPMNASQYFRTMINLAEKLKIPTELTSYDDVRIQQNNLKAQFLKLNPTMPSNGIVFSCQSIKSQPILTDVRVCYKANGQYNSCSSQVVSNCPREFLIKGSY